MFQLENDCFVEQVFSALHELIYHARLSFLQGHFAQPSKAKLWRNQPTI